MLIVPVAETVFSALHLASECMVSEMREVPSIPIIVDSLSVEQAHAN